MDSSTPLKRQKSSSHSTEVETADDDQPPDTGNCTDQQFITSEMIQVTSKGMRTSVRQAASKAAACITATALHESLPRRKGSRSQLQSGEACHICDKVLKGVVELEAHLEIHADERPFKCSMCSKAFKYKKCIERHILSNHKALAAPASESATSLTTASFEHGKSASDGHSSKTEGRCVDVADGSSVQCDRIDKSTDKESSVKKIDKYDGDQENRSNNPEDAIQLSDTDCLWPSVVTDAVDKMKSDSYTGSSSLLQKMCQFCGRTFAKPSERLRHLMKHTGERLFECDLCVRKFKAKPNLQYHMRAVHGVMVELSPALESKFTNTKKYRKRSRPDSVDSTNLQQAFKNQDEDVGEDDDGDDNNVRDNGDGDCEDYSSETPLSICKTSLSSPPFMTSINSETNGVKVKIEPGLFEKSNKQSTDDSEIKDPSHPELILEEQKFDEDDDDDDVEEDDDDDDDEDDDDDDDDQENVDDAVGSECDEGSNVYNVTSLKYPDRETPCVVKYKVNPQSEETLVSRVVGVNLASGEKSFLFKCHWCSKVFLALEALQNHLSVHLRRSLKTYACVLCGEIFQMKNQLRAHNCSHVFLLDSNQKLNGHCQRRWVVENRLTPMDAVILQPGEPNKLSDMTNDVIQAKTKITKREIQPVEEEDEDDNDDDDAGVNDDDNNINVSMDTGETIEVDAEVAAVVKVEEDGEEETIADSEVCESKSANASRFFTPEELSQMASAPLSILVDMDGSGSNPTTATAAAVTTQHEVAFSPSTEGVPTWQVGGGDGTKLGYRCRYCPKMFDRLYSLNRHERVHTGVKPCYCKECGKGFSEPRNLRHHIIRFHSDGSQRHLLRRARDGKKSSLLYGALRRRGKKDSPFRKIAPKPAPPPLPTSVTPTGSLISNVVDTTNCVSLPTSHSVLSSKPSVPLSCQVVSQDTTETCTVGEDRTPQEGVWIANSDAKQDPISPVAELQLTGEEAVTVIYPTDAPDSPRVQTDDMIEQKGVNVCDTGLEILSDPKRSLIGNLRKQKAHRNASSVPTKDLGSRPADDGDVISSESSSHPALQVMVLARLATASVPFEATIPVSTKRLGLSTVQETLNGGSGNSRKLPESSSVIDSTTTASVSSSSSLKQQHQCLETGYKDATTSGVSILKSSETHAEPTKRKGNNSYFSTYSPR